MTTETHNNISAHDRAVVDAYRRVHFGNQESENQRTIDRYGQPEGVSDDPLETGALEFEPLDQPTGSESI